MTEQELNDEWQYRYQERLGILCGAAIPTPEQRTIARNEANEAISKLKEPETQMTFEP